MIRGKIGSSLFRNGVVFATKPLGIALSSSTNDRSYTVVASMKFSPASAATVLSSNNVRAWSKYASNASDNSGNNNNNASFRSFTTLNGSSSNGVIHVRFFSTAKTETATTTTEEGSSKSSSSSSAPSQQQQQQPVAAAAVAEDLKFGFIKLPAILHPKNAAVDASFNRWKAVPAAFLLHVSIGSLYAWSVFNEPLTRALGVVHSSSADWTLTDILPVFSAVLAFHGICGALVGNWQEKVGPRAAMLAGAMCYGGGFIIGGYGAILHNLPLIILGYGVLGGTGVGLSYVPPIATLVRWFPDRKGLATGMALCGFGGGALLATPFAEGLLKANAKLPEFLGLASDMHVITEQGKRLVEVGGEMKEVVIAKTADLASEGVFLVGSGSTGIGSTMIFMGATYFVTMAIAAFAIRTPPKDYAPPGWVIPAPTAGSLVSLGYCTSDVAIRTPQFWLIWTQIVCLASGGFALASVAKNMMSDIFGSALPLVVTAGFASTFVMAMSVANLGGRLLWSSVSDYIGRKAMFGIFTGVSIPLYLAMPYCCFQVSVTPTIAPLVMFYASAIFAFSFFAGAFSTAPAFEADLFGSKYVGAIHGRMLTAVTTASIIGPQAIAALRKSSEVSAIKDLAMQVHPTGFLDAFGAPVTELDALIAAKTVTIKGLLHILPPGTVDPTPFLYNSTMYSAVGLMVFAAAANLAIRPVDEKYKKQD